jgi:CHAD domain-containing protein
MRSFTVSIAAEVSDFENTLSNLCSYTTKNVVGQTVSFYDTFDWKLYDLGLVASRSGNELALVPLAGDSGIYCDVGEHWPVYAWDLPEGALHRRLSPILKARAMLALADVYVEETTYRILNDDAKTVAWAVHAAVRAGCDVGSQLLSTYVSVRPLRGYEGHAHRLARQLAPDGTVCSLTEAIYLDALDAAGRSPNDYSAKLDVNLDPTQRADDATKVVLRRLLQTLRANEAGIRADIDIEFLHDYRVAIRRTRSALSQVRGVFPAETSDRFKQDFRTLGRRTNQLRDLDVYLLAEPGYRAMLPAAIQPDIKPLFDLLRSQRETALATVIEGLDTPDYATILSGWADFLDQPGHNDPSAPNAGMPIIELARNRIYKRYRRIVKDGGYILDHTEDELLHALRLECKNLRYLLEFFASLFPTKQAYRLIKQLKHLQDNLGDFTDLTVQQASLLAMAYQLPDNAPSTRGALIATGALVETLARQQRMVKANFAETFTHFAAPANQRAYRKLFAPKKK